MKKKKKKKEERERKLRENICLGLKYVDPNDGYILGLKLTMSWSI